MFIGFNVAFLPMHFTGLRGMPRRVFTYPEGLGWDWLNLISTIGAFVLAAGIAVIVYDVLWPRGAAAPREANPWNAGTLEWLTTHAPWAVRTVPHVDSRYPLWDQPDFVRKVDEGALLPAGRRGGKARDPDHDAARRRAGAVPAPAGQLFRADAGRDLHRRVLHLHDVPPVLDVARVRRSLALGAILSWLWTGTALIPEKAEKDVGLGLTCRSTRRARARSAGGRCSSPCSAT